ncbi:hypothetical protein AVV36_gp036 [Pectobacterium bacteriophage PM2]|uniref:Uncharacterized protein n=1 Tax=Pectobacterium bacteriophage PM2 TaxID=1429794 RepID=A0A0A0Q0H5_9CAUD|nr:hypothetical protein AVV36_gp036 [Pectobacterium bacteriophage PM2]AHY24998.1 hypothetical protein PM2_036 [Pectobacterium bacteriophage PM2]
MEEVECVVCLCSVPENEAVFDYMDNATCTDCDREQAEYELYLGEEE